MCERQKSLSTCVACVFLYGCVLARVYVFACVSVCVFVCLCI